MIAFLSGVVVGLVIGALVGFTIAVLATVQGGAFENVGYFGAEDRGGPAFRPPGVSRRQKVETRRRGE
jgi:hypothetical protein